MKEGQESRRQRWLARGLYSSPLSILSNTELSDLPHTMQHDQEDRQYDPDWFNECSHLEPAPENIGSDLSLAAMRNAAHPSLHHPEPYYVVSSKEQPTFAKSQHYPALPEWGSFRRETVLNQVSLQPNGWFFDQQRSKAHLHLSSSEDPSGTQGFPQASDQGPPDSRSIPSDDIPIDPMLSLSPSLGQETRLDEASLRPKDKPFGQQPSKARRYKFISVDPSGTQGFPRASVPMDQTLNLSPSLGQEGVLAEASLQTKDKSFSQQPSKARYYVFISEDPSRIQSFPQFSGEGPAWSLSLPSNNLPMDQMVKLSPSATVQPDRQGQCTNMGKGVYSMGKESGLPSPVSEAHIDGFFYNAETTFTHINVNGKFVELGFGFFWGKQVNPKSNSPAWRTGGADVTISCQGLNCSQNTADCSGKVGLAECSQPRPSSRQGNDGPLVMGCRVTAFTCFCETHLQENEKLYLGSALHNMRVKW